MKALFSLVAISALSAVASPALAASSYYSHGVIMGADDRGKFNVDYIQLIPRKGVPLTPAQLKVNATLAKEANDLICPATTDKSRLDFMLTTQKTKVSFVSDRLISVDMYQEQDCGAHPGDGKYSQLFDLKTGEEISLSTGLPVGDKARTETPEFTAVMTNAMLAHSRALIAAGKVPADCKNVYNANQLASYPSISLSPRAITVEPTFAHVIEVCRFDTVIPLAKFAKVAKPGSLLEQLVKGAPKH